MAAACAFLAGAACAKGPPPAPLQGRIENGVYLSAGGAFTVAVPEMRNPFIKEPSAIADRDLAEGGAEVDFAVLELGEAHRFGVREANAGADLDEFFRREISRWTQHWTGTTGKLELLLEDATESSDAAGGIGRVYLVDGASLLFASKGGRDPQRASALVGVVAIPVVDAGRVLYLVSQFDMPNRGGHHTLDTERGRLRLSEQHLKRMRELSATLRLP